MNVRKCQCGAVTVEIDGEYYSMPLKLFRQKFPNVRVPSKKLYNCDYCVNHWGVDLCGCGSGEKFGKCKNGYPECSRPAQDIKNHVQKCYCESGW